jgi:hypothetical protein
MELLSDRELNTIRGKSMVGHASVAEILSVFGHIDALEAELDEFEQDDTFGTEGWRHAFGHPDAD